MILIKEAIMEKAKIKCSVKDCKYNKEHEVCSLDEIKVCHCDPEEKKEATMCDSYKKCENRSN